MNAATATTDFTTETWGSLHVTATDAGYAVYEAEARFWRERLAESALRLTGMFLILAGYVQWFLPDAMMQGDPMLAHVALSVAFMGTGMGLYFFASRGFRKELHFDMFGKTLGLARLNGKNRSMVNHLIDMDRIESLCVSRAATPMAMASLILRVKGFPRTHCVMRGTPAEIEKLHRQLSRDIRIALTVADPVAKSRAPQSAWRPVTVRRVTPSRPRAVCAHA
jgi:hypothetical protein